MTHAPTQLTTLTKTDSQLDKRVAVTGIMQGQPTLEVDDKGTSFARFRMRVNLMRWLTEGISTAVVVRSELWIIAVYGSLAEHLCTSDLGPSPKINVVGTFTDRQPTSGAGDFAMSAVEIFVSLASTALGKPTADADENDY